MTRNHKWVPVVTDYCTGCGSCVEACPHGCLELVWDFATLQRSDACIGDGHCVEACPQEECIQMEWVAATGSQEVGRWCESPEPTAPAPTSWLGSLFRKRPAVAE